MRSNDWSVCQSLFDQVVVVVVVVVVSCGDISKIKFCLTFQNKVTQQQHQQVILSQQNNLFT